MKNLSTILLLAFISIISITNAQESETEYIEFNDRNNTVHGVYIGLSYHYGQIDKADTYSSSLKIAYVANQQFEVGFVGTGFYSDLNGLGVGTHARDLVGFYGGLHLEPILFSKSKINVSFPILVGGGAVGLLDDHWDDLVVHDDAWDPIFVFEPGVNLLYNISRYIQIEAGVKYRLSSNIDLKPEHDLSNINGFSAGLGIKVGVFNMGRNRYKKHPKNEN
jgi:hypothetical protein